ncbi:MAG: di-trans,poly-cis-decaprenylcistransferase [Anaerolineales bacterium]|nr:di-trans,poly-cis-decaprenylcistransferase [Anaerolineales bacterium]
MTNTSKEGLTPTARLPTHVAIIMDGNGRWARLRGLPRLAGHRAGVENLRRIIRATVKSGIRHLTLYAFSTENWNRPAEEVQGLLALIERSLKRELPELHQQGVKLRHLGRLDRLTPSLQQKVREAIALTRANQRLTLNIAFNYGGRAEISHAIQRILRDRISSAEVNEELVSQYLYTYGQPDPDLIIRTGGELRLSNFLLWQGAHALFYTTEVYWPDFDETAFENALTYYAANPHLRDEIPAKAA